ncbi:MULTISPECIES: YeiH family protein [Photorhabdus]|uniref:YeiH family putative sulfate export transporter n=1 Tax=Photorhabdus kayaii TaxID=230088 RepID=A0ABX0AUZ6_9GAMM|nr:MULTISPECIES: YeiH family protein [Photorhabdus]MCC8373491.1 YeiH family putative sulfate export transporter [Photorhabdus bodei]MCT8352544.1 YeiH family protein [Photorhabdus kayaii]MDB6367769.1 YeiH family protein [Photorhabdus bodei]NDL12097.1 YeiH family putative sulfate export transporter [Photorhabdus kayaii]NDL24635.1 YeiH family putative sulfate export transporter [Photorhabdus kayaii]
MSDIRAKKFSKQSSIPGMKLIFGLILAATLTAISIYAGNIPWFINMGLGTLTLAILAGIIAGNTVYPLLKPYCDEGIHFSKHYLLRAGIILYGFRLTFQQIADVGITGLLIDAAMLSSTFFIAMWLGKSLFGLDQQTVILIGAGSSICGAAAIMATEPVVNAPASKVAVAVSTIVIFGTIAIFIYPWFYQLNELYQWLPLTQETFGIFTGSTLHEVAQVVAVGHAISDQTENAAVISKMIRVMMLAPFLLLLSRYISRAHTKNGRNHQEKTPMTIPWFAVIFIAIAGLNSFNLLPAAIINSLINIDTIMLTMAMGALGLTTHVSAIRQAGFKPILLALILFVWLMAGGLLINLGIQHLFG